MFALFTPQEQRLAYLAALDPPTKPPPHEGHTLLHWDKADLSLIHEQRLGPLLAWHIEQSQKTAALSQYAETLGASSPDAHTPLTQWRHDCFAAFSPSQRQQLRDWHKQSWMASLTREHAFRQVHQELHRASIPVIVHKGLAYRYLCYPDPSVRPMGDVDIFVAPQHEEQLTALLQALGYKWIPYAHPFERFFLHPTTRMNIDVHLGVTLPYESQLCVETLFAHVSPQGTEGYLCLDPGPRLLLHLYHQLKHGLEVTLLTYVEARILYQQAQEDWSQVEACAEAWQLKRILHAGLWGLQQLYPDLTLPSLHITSSQRWLSRWLRHPPQLPSRRLRKLFRWASHTGHKIHNIDRFSQRVGYLGQLLQQRYKQQARRFHK